MFSKAANQKNDRIDSPSNELDNVIFTSVDLPPSVFLREKNGLFGALPGELQNEIFKHLDYPAAMFLGATNRYFRSLNLPSLIGEDRKLAFIREAEGFLQHSSGHEYMEAMACCACYRVRPFAKFHWIQRDLKPYAQRAVDDWLVCRYCRECGERRTTHWHDAKAEAFDDGRRRLLLERFLQLSSSSSSSSVWICDVCLDLGVTFVNYGCPGCGKCVRICAGHDIEEQQFCGECEVALVLGRQRRECLHHGLYYPSALFRQFIV